MPTTTQTASTSPRRWHEEILGSPAGPLPSEAPTTPATATSGPAAAPRRRWSAELLGIEPAVPSSAEPEGGGVGMNAVGGAYGAVATIAGAPVDAANAVIRSLVDAPYNFVTGSEGRHLSTDEPYGGSASINRVIDAAGLPTPDNTEAVTPAERRARAVGAGAVGALIPWGGARTIAGEAAAAAPSIGRAVVDALRSGGAASNATIGAAGGAGGQTVDDTLAEIWPDAPAWLRQLARIGGELVGGGAGALTSSATGAATSQVGRTIGRATAPMRVDGRDALAGQAILDAANDPATLRNRIADGAVELVPGSQPTTAQAANDPGLLALERGVSRTPAGQAPFIDRANQQSAARAAALDGVAPAGDPTAPGTLMRQQFDAIAEQADQRVMQALDDFDANAAGTVALADQVAGRATQARDAALDGLGGQRPVNQYGADIRAELEAAKRAEKAATSKLYAEVDPDGTLALDITPIRQAALRIRSDLPKASTLGAEESRLLGVLGDMPPVEKFGEVMALRSELTAAIREERFLRGETPALRRMQQLRSAVEGAIDGGPKPAATGDALNVEMRAVIDEPGRTVEEIVRGTTADDRPQPGAKVRVYRGDRLLGEGVVREYTDDGRVVFDKPVRGVMTSPLDKVRMEAIPDALTGAAPAPTADGSRVFTPSGRSLDVRYEVVDAASLRTASGKLQPRDRTRAASEGQISDIARNLQPERLGASPELGAGAPLINDAGTVLDGNGRFQAIARAHESGGPASQRYRDFLSQQGYDTRGMRAPVLVRRPVKPLSPDEEVALAREANAPKGLAYSATERAVLDGDRLTDDVVSLFQGGALDDAGNRAMVRRFASKIDPAERGGFANGAGALSLDGKRRMEGAFLHRAYGDAKLVDALTETGDDNIRAFGRALTDAAPAVAQLRAAIARGEVSADLDPSRHVLEAVRLVQRARSSGTPLADVLAQADAFNPVDPIAAEILTAAYGTSLSRVSQARATAALTAYVDEAMKAGASGQMFDAPDALSVVRSAVRRAAGVGDDTAMPPPSATPRPAPGNASVIDDAPVEANFDAGAAGRYRAANERYGEFAETFKGGPVGNVLHADKGSGFRVADSEVAGRFFNGGKRAKEDVDALVRAVGTRQGARDALFDYAASSLRSYAMKPDGSFDLARYRRWLSKHGPALRALDQIDGAAGLQQKFRQIKEAQRIVDAIAASRADLDKGLTADRKALAKGLEGERKVTVKEFQDSAARFFLDGAEPTVAVRRAFGSANPRESFADLMGKMQADPEALTGLRRAVLEHMQQRLRGTAEAGDTGALIMKPDMFQRFVRDNRGVLNQVFGTGPAGTLDNIAKDLQRTTRSVSGSKLPGGSDTEQIRQAGGMMPGGSFLSHLVRGALRVGVAGGGAAGGAAMGGMAGAGVGALAGGVAAEAMRIGREMGLEAVNRLIVDAMLDPDKALALLAKVPPSDPGFLSRMQAQFGPALLKAPVAGEAAQRTQRPSILGAPAMPDVH